MAKINTKKTDARIDKTVKLAGGAGIGAAVQKPEALLRRAVMANLLWEDIAYESGKYGANNIANLVPQVEPHICAEIAIEARTKQKLRHVPLLIAREMARHPKHRKILGELLPQIIKRPDEIGEFLAIYWKDKKEPLANQVKLGLARAFDNFNEYQFGKWKTPDAEVSLQDAIRVVHPTAQNPGQNELFRKIRRNELLTPNTWETRMSAGEKPKDVFEDLMLTNKLGALAFLRNLRKMQESKVDPVIIKEYFGRVNAEWLLPINYLAARQYAPQYTTEIQAMMLNGFMQLPKLPGKTVFGVDVSGSMGAKISGKSEYSRMQVACAMAMMAREVCEYPIIYATAGDDGAGKHATMKIPDNVRGFELITEIEKSKALIGGGGIFTRQCLEFIKAQEGQVDRIIVFSDSQDCDRVNKVPAPFGSTNYIVDVSSNARGINYDGVWTASVSGWSEHFLTYIASLEGLQW